jgi:acetyl-CoA C-acetyltransferase
MAPLAGPRLGALAIEEALKRANVEKEAVDEVYMGNVIPAGMMQAPDRQASLYAGIPTSVPCTMVNKVCSSGMKAIMLAAGNLAMGRSKIAVAGGFESMSNVPYYLKRGKTDAGNLPDFSVKLKWLMNFALYI